VVWQSEPGYIGLDTYDVLRQHVVSHHFRFGEDRQVRVFRSPIATFGLQSWISWLS
jgi:hypothetical protein